MATASLDGTVCLAAGRGRGSVRDGGHPQVQLSPRSPALDIRAMQMPRRDQRRPSPHVRLPDTPRKHTTVLWGPQVLWEVLHGATCSLLTLLPRDTREGWALPGPTQDTPIWILLLGTGLGGAAARQSPGASLGFPKCGEASHPLPRPARQTDPSCICPPVLEAASPCPCRPDFLSEVTLGATGARRPIKLIEAEREPIKQVTPLQSPFALCCPAPAQGLGTQGFQQRGSPSPCRMLEGCVPGLLSPPPPPPPTRFLGGVWVLLCPAQGLTLTQGDRDCPLWPSLVPSNHPEPGSTGCLGSPGTSCAHTLMHAHRHTLTPAPCAAGSRWGAASVRRSGMGVRPGVHGRSGPA